MSENKKSNRVDEASLIDEEAQQRETYDLLISEEEREKAEAEDARIDQDLAAEEVFDTQHSDGHTYNVREAQVQGLTYTPPTDPPVLPGDDPEGAEVAAGFGLNMEEHDPATEELPAPVETGDLELRDNVMLVLRNNSQTGHLDTIKVQVDDGRVNLIGSVESEEEIALVHEIVNELNGVVSIQNNLQVETDAR